MVGALNRDLPYDQFIVEQLAGDQLSHTTQDQVVATGFLRNSMLNEEEGIDPEQFRMEAMFDRMDAAGKSVGLTIQCAQCHNHKFDPITQEDYYRLFAFLNNDHESQNFYGLLAFEELMTRDAARSSRSNGRGRPARAGVRLASEDGRLGASLAVEPTWEVLALRVRG